MSSEQSTTTDENKISILGELWLNYRFDEDFEDFFTYNDLGLPLAYMLDTGIVTKTDKALTFINETWNLLLAGLEIEDTGFETLDDILDQE